MARRKKTSPAEDLIELVAMLPWWAGVALALLSYLLLHQVAAQPLTAPAQPVQVSAMVTQGLWKGLASAGQYILPIICLAAAGMSAWRRKVRESLMVSSPTLRAEPGERRSRLHELASIRAARGRGFSSPGLPISGDKLCVDSRNRRSRDERSAASEPDSRSDRCARHHVIGDER